MQMTTSARRLDRAGFPKAEEFVGSNPTGRTRAALYCRISQTDPNVEAVADQERRCRDLADREGYQVVAVYSDDGISAFTGKTRPGWLALNDDLAADKFNVILAVAEDRLTRSAEEKIGFQASCARAGVVWHTVASGRLDPSTAQGGLLGTITGAVAQYESHIKRERVQASVERRLRDGIDLNGPRPFGFEADRKTIREAEAAWVRWAIQAVLDGTSLYRIRQHLNDQGVLTSTGKPWGSTIVVRQMLLRPRNVGLLVHRGAIISDTLTPLVPRADWEAARDILEHPDRKPKPGPKIAHLASGIVFCAVCGSSMRHHTPDRGVPKYVCKRENLTARDDRSHPTMRAAELNAMLPRVIFTMLATGGIQAPDSRDDAAPLRIQRAESARKRAVQQTLAEMAGADLEAIAKRIGELGREIAVLDERIAEATAASATDLLVAAAVESLTPIDSGGGRWVDESIGLRRFAAAWESLGLERQRETVRTLLGRVELTPDALDFPDLDARFPRGAWNTAPLDSPGPEREAAAMADWWANVRKQQRSTK